MLDGRYTDAAEDDTFHAAIVRIQANIVAKARAAGLVYPEAEGGSIYPNYALAGAGGAHVIDFYGAAHLAEMRRVAAEVDPHGVMRLAGGWKV
jgi:hypothetical protein